jgi:hypothetical protein
LNGNAISHLIILNYSKWSSFIHKRNGLMYKCIHMNHETIRFPQLWGTRSRRHGKVNRTPDLSTFISTTFPTHVSYGEYLVKHAGIIEWLECVQSLILDHYYDSFVISWAQKLSLFRVCNCVGCLPYNAWIDYI